MSNVAKIDMKPLIEDLRSLPIRWWRCVFWHSFNVQNSMTCVELPTIHTSLKMELAATLGQSATSRRAAYAKAEETSTQVVHMQLNKLAPSERASMSEEQLGVMVLLNMAQLYAGY